MARPGFDRRTSAIQYDLCCDTQASCKRKQLKTITKERQHNKHEYRGCWRQKPWAPDTSNSTVQYRLSLYAMLLLPVISKVPRYESTIWLTSIHVWHHRIQFVIKCFACPWVHQRRDTKSATTNKDTPATSYSIYAHHYPQCDKAWSRFDISVCVSTMWCFDIRHCT